MKTIFAAVMLALSLSAAAQENAVVLDAEKISVNGASATVLRTNKTPETVEISFNVPMANSVCERYETRYVVRASASYCGEDVFRRRVPAGRVCVRKNPYNDECLAWQDTFREETVYRPRICPVPETYCAQYGTATMMERDSMKIKFKNLPALGDSESESFTITAQQKRYDNGDVVYEVTPVQTLREYKISQKKFLFFKRDFYVVEEK